MHSISILQNTIQPYLWGSRTALAELLGNPSPASEPQAELWMGAHPKAPSVVTLKDDTDIRLDKLIEAYPDDILGAAVARRFDNRLPYLFKVLAAAHPLSVQAHPSRDQARKGFERENRAAIPLGAPHRNYRDANHKPECICALTPFWALCGFRPANESIELFQTILPRDLDGPLEALGRRQTPEGLRAFFGSLMNCPQKTRKRVLDEAAKQARPFAATHPVFRWFLKLVDAYGEDMGVFAPLLLNLVCLQPGQALYLKAGVLHAYLEGVGIELMANSDNVLRGGLTPKHVDVPELMKTLSFTAKHLDVLEPVTVRDNEKQYLTKAEEFALSVISLDASGCYASPPERSVEILLCIDGRAVIEAVQPSQIVAFKKGDALLIPAAAGRYTLAGQTTLYKATVPLATGS